MIEIIEHIEGLVSNKLARFKTLISIFKLEMRLTALSAYPLILSICLIFVVLITIWLSVMCLIGYLIVLYWHIPLLAFCLVLLLNLMFFAVFLKCLLYNLNNMSFKKTRAYLSPNENNKYGKFKKTISQGYHKTGKKITIPAKSNHEA